MQQPDEIDRDDAGRPWGCGPTTASEDRKRWDRTEAAYLRRREAADERKRLERAGLVTSAPTTVDVERPLKFWGESAGAFRARLAASREETAKAKLRLKLLLEKRGAWDYAADQPKAEAFKDLLAPKILCGLLALLVFVLSVAQLAGFFE